MFAAFAAFALAIAANVAAAQLDPAHTALARALADGDDMSCSPAELATIVRGAGMQPLGMLGTHRVVLASPHGSCICGSVNCPYFVLRLNGGPSSVLLSTFAAAVRSTSNARPLPDLLETAHDSAFVSVETHDVFRNGAYVVVSTMRVRGDDGARKPLAIPVRFAAGASSARLDGRVSPGWGDDYTLDATAGQQLTIDRVHAPAALAFRLSGPGVAAAETIRPGTPLRLPSAGTYRIHVDSAIDGAQSYRATVSIR